VHTLGATKEAFMTRKLEGSVRWPGWLGAVACLAFLAAGTAQAESHYGIISTARTSPQTMARINASAGEPDAAAFTVFPADQGIPLTGVVQLDVALFASSASSTEPGIQNLFVGAGARTALVKVEMFASRSSAVLEQSSFDGKVALNLPPFQVAAGQRFLVSIGDLQQGTSLLVGNVNQTAVPVDLRYGTNLPEPDVLINAFGVAVFNITQSNTSVVLEAKGPLPIIVQLAVDTGKTTVMTYLTPLLN
jgi:hypothetical protein